MSKYGKKTRGATPKRKAGSKSTHELLRRIERPGSAQRKAWLARTREECPKRKRESKKAYSERLALFRARSLSALRAAATREKRRTNQEAIREFTKAREEKLKGTPGSKRRYRKAKEILLALVESETEREQREFREKVDAAFEKHRREREELERKRAEKRIRAAEEERLAELENARNERAAAVITAMREQLAEIVGVARQMLPEVEPRRSLSFGEGKETRGHKRDIRIDKVVDEQSVQGILAKVDRRTRGMPGKFPLWLATVWMTVMGDQVVGSFKVRTDMLSREDRTLVESHLQSLMADSTGVQRNRADTLRVLRQMFNKFLTTKFANTLVHVHMVTMWNYTKVRVEAES